MRRVTASASLLVLACPLLLLTRCGSAEERAIVPASDAGDAAADAALEAEPNLPPLNRVKCAQREGPARCFGCDANEDCFTSVSCGLVADGGSICNFNGDVDAVGDDSCHTSCDGDSDCPSSQRCRYVFYFGCYDFNGGPNGKGKGICCRDDERCPSGQ